MVVFAVRGFVVSEIRMLREGDGFKFKSQNKDIYPDLYFEFLHCDSDE